MKTFIMLSATLLLSQLSAANIALIGGGDLSGSAPAYGALISSDGTVTNLPNAGGAGNLPSSGFISSVGLNALGYGIVGGRDHSGAMPAYAALVSPAGVITNLPNAGGAGNLPSMGVISAVGINLAGTGIIGGVDTGSIAPYAALVSPAGAVTNLPNAGGPGNLPSIGNILSVSINNNGFSIIGGSDASGPVAPYAALVSPAGVVTNLPNAGGAGNLPATGLVTAVAINASGSSIVAGDDGSSPPFAALVSPGAVITNLPNAGGAGNLPTVGEIKDVAINSSGVSVIGGRDFNGSTPAYVAIVSPAGVVTNLPNAGGPGNLPSVGQIESVAINSSGTIIVGGNDASGTSPAYAAFVSPSGVITNLPNAGGPGNLPAFGIIDGVAINEAGVALIGGEDSSGLTPAYAALVSPSGVVTNLPNLGGIGNLPSFGYIDEVALVEEILDEVVPESVGPGSSFSYALFILTADILPDHMTRYNGLEYRPSLDKSDSEIGLLADLSPTVRMKTDADRNQTPNYCFWGSVLGDYIHQKKEKDVPSFNDWIASAILGFDYLGVDNTVIGTAASYALSYIHLAQGIGHAKFNQEFLTFYGSWRTNHLFLHGALWGGLYQAYNERHSLGFLTATASFDGWLLTPHFEVRTPFYIKKNWLALEPFAMFDFANNWQGRFHEHGPSDLNIVIDSQYTSVLRSEIGVRCFEIIAYEWGSLVLQEKASYVNKAPFHTGLIPAFFVGSVSTFDVEVFSSQVQNLGAVQMKVDFVPRSLQYPYGSINYRGEFGSTFQSHLLSVEVGKDF